MGKVSQCAIIFLSEKGVCAKIKIQPKVDWFYLKTRGTIWG